MFTNRHMHKRLRSLAVFTATAQGGIGGDDVLTKELHLSLVLTQLVCRLACIQPVLALLDGDHADCRVRELVGRGKVRDPVMDNELKYRDVKQQPNKINLMKQRSVSVCQKPLKFPSL